MKKNHLLRTILLSTLFALLSIVLMTPVASAHTATSARRAATATGQTPASNQNVNIVTRHGKAVFSPTVVHCNAHDLTNPCFTLTNTTNVPQQLVFHGHNSLILGPGVYMTFGFGQGVFIYSLKSNPHAHLTVLSS